MRAMERTDAEMHDAGAHRAAVIGWAVDAGRQLGQRSAGKAGPVQVGKPF